MPINCFMKRNSKIRFLVQAAIIAALYAVLTHLQNILLPGLTSGAIQFRSTEAMCVLAFFTPAAIPGLTLGCLVFNLTSGYALPLDFLLGSLASLLSALGMWYCRNIKILKFPLLGMLFPVLFNAVIVGWELTVYIGDAFHVNALYVAAGEAAVISTLGTVLYFAIKSRNLDKRIFSLT